MFEVEARRRRRRWTNKAEQQLGRNPKRKSKITLRQFLRIRDENKPIPMRSVVKAYRSFQRKSNRLKGSGRKMSQRDRAIYRQIVNHMIKNLPRSKRERVMGNKPKPRPKPKRPSLKPRRPKKKRRPSRQKKWRPNTRRRKRANMMLKIAIQHVEDQIIDDLRLPQREVPALRRFARDMLLTDPTLDAKSLRDMVITYW